MIKFLLPIFILIFHSIKAQSVQFNLYTLYDEPVKKIMPNMSNNIGLGFSLGYQPNSSIPIYFELDMNHASNSSLTESRSVGFTDGTTKTYYDNYRAHTNKFLIGTKFFAGREFNAFKFFVTPQIGVLNFNARIEYPDLYHYQTNSTEFKRITEKFQRSFCSVYGGQVGIEIHINNLRRKSSTDDHRIQLSFNMLQSFSTLNYINLNKTEEFTEASTHLGVDQLVFPNNETIANPIYCENYKTKLSMWGIHVGYIFTFGSNEE